MIHTFTKKSGCLKSTGQSLFMLRMVLISQRLIQILMISTFNDHFPSVLAGLITATQLRPGQDTLMM